MAELKLTQQMFDRAKANKCVGWFYMDPRDYLRLTIDEANVDAWIAHEGDEVQSLEAYNSYNITLMPWLDVDMHSGKVVGHEGRHRAAACIKAGVKKFPVAICLREQGYPTYYRQPFIDEYENPKQLMKVFVTKDDVPSMLKGQFRAASVSIKSNIAHMQEFWAQENRVTAQLHKGKTVTTKELSALKRLVVTASSSLETAGAIETFIKSLGIPDGSYKPAKKKGQHTWELRCTKDADLKLIKDTLTKKLGSPAAVNEAEDEIFWVVKGKGLVVFGRSAGWINVISAESKSIATDVVLMVDGYDDSTRLKFYNVKPSTKTIDYTLYDGDGRREAAFLFKKLLKSLGLTGWTVNIGARSDEEGEGITVKV